MSKAIKGKGAQISIFVIIAIVIVAGIGIYFIVRGADGGVDVPSKFEPAYSSYTSCIEDISKEGALILGQKGGYVNSPEFSPGNEYMPFSSELDFLGTGVPYWYAVLGNGVVREQVPSVAKMQSDLNIYIEERISLCDFSEVGEIDMSFGPVEVESIIRDNQIELIVNQDVDISSEETSWSKESHSVSIDSNLGKLYETARAIYAHQKEGMFLENYGVDILRLYAPVDGSEIGCSPKIWNLFDVREDLKDALEGNVPAVKLKGDYYTLSNPGNKYFEIDVGRNIDVTTNFLYLKEWPMRLEVWPSDGNFLIQEPVGLDENLGLLGFCYVPYHFVYDLAYPVMIQLFAGDEIFQFPVVVLIDKNNPRKALPVEGIPDVVPELCLNKVNEMTVYTRDDDLNPVSADVKFKCFNTICNIGKSEIVDGEAVLSSNFPQCINGFVVGSANGYETGKFQVTSASENTAVVILDKKYEIDLEVHKQGFDLNEEFAVISFISDDAITTLSYPEQDSVELSEGQYEIRAYIYSNASITLEGSKTEKCVDVPRGGILGAFGSTEKKCFVTEIPSQMVSFAISGGGIQDAYLTKIDLQSDSLIINSKAFRVPKEALDLQFNYNNVEVNGLDIIFE
jgi:hypothetical protein